MIKKLAKNQNWAKACPWLGLLTAILLFAFFKAGDPKFWALINIPLYLFHQTEEHYKPGGFKTYMNEKVFALPKGEEKLTDSKVFWINILVVWIAFLIFGALTFVNIGFGLCIVIFSIINCVTHMVQGVKRREWNPGLVMAAVQFSISLYASYFITTHGLENIVAWWIGSVIFSALSHGIVFKLVMSKKQTDNE